MTRMPRWLPMVLILICALGIGDFIKPEITRNDLLTMTAIIVWAIMSKNEVKE